MSEHLEQSITQEPENGEGQVGNDIPTADATMMEQPDSEAAATDGEPAVEDWQALVQSVTGQPDGAPIESDPVVQLVHEYKEAIKARDAWEDKYLRAAAEFANARRRAELRAENQIWAARERVLTNILPILDDFERAFQAVPEEEQGSPWVEGFRLILRKLETILDREGVTRIEAAGQPFDPNLHQAVVMEEAAEVESGMVLDVLQQGYMLNDRVLRPSMVRVSQ